jgi:feruloyl-CoA synthase
MRRPWPLLTPSVVRTPVADGVVLASPTPLPTPAPTVLHWLDRWAAAAPERTLVAERDAEGGWRRASYGEVARRVGGVAALLRARGAGPTAPVLVLADNSIAHLVVALAAMHAGAPVAPVSPAYALASTTYGRLRSVVDQVGAAAVFVEEKAPFLRALAVVGLGPDQVLDANDVAAAAEGPAAPRAAIGPDTVAKILFTSGSTGEPKGVVNTHRMLTANQESLAACWPFLAEHPPVLVDWLPWSHTFGGNHDLHLVLRNGGSLYVDRGRPAPGLVEVTLRNLAAVGPNLWFNVPRGFDQAVDLLEREPELARAVFRNLRLIFYAAAALAPTTRARLEAVARAAGHGDVFFTSAWGSTETAPLATSAHFPTPTTGVLGVPVPGVELKLATVDDRLELRVKGPNVTPGYWARGGAIRPVALDADGFLPTGDAGRLVDEAHPERGLVFAGRIAENFKLSSGTWVNVGAARLALVDACAPLVQDAVLAGHDRAHLGALLLLSPTGTAGLPADEVRLRLRRALEAHAHRHPGSSEHPRRALVLDRPLSLDDGETTDKGYTNQRRVLQTRASDVARLFADPPDGDVFVLG